MYKILVVDDDVVIHEGMRDHIRWGELGYHLLVIYERGLITREALESYQPDVLLTDIYMPFVYGLELVEYVTRHHPRTKLIILTGHDDLDKDRENLQNWNKINEQMQASLPLLRMMFLNQWVAGDLTEEKIFERMKDFDISLSGKYISASVIDLDDTEEIQAKYPDTDNALLLFAIQNICEEISQTYGEHPVVFNNYLGQIVLLFSGEEALSLMDMVEKASIHILQAVKDYLKLSISVGIGLPWAGTKVLHLSYEGALSALDFRFLLGRNQVIPIYDMAPKERVSVYSTKSQSAQLANALKTGNSEDMHAIIHLFFEKLISGNIPMKECCMHIQILLFAVMDVWQELHISEDQILKKNIFEEIIKMKTLQEAKHWFIQVFEITRAFIVQKRTDTGTLLAGKAKQFILDNLTDPGLTSSIVCKHLSISASYFCIIFKNYTNMTFIEFLTLGRINKAKELLWQTSLKTYEIAELAGYKDAHYFSIAFRKSTGMSPTQFRESRNRGNEDGF
ncbi:helix-turn-helix domain-containing protein [Paenibacillus chondroitinus]|uniref:Helix-turn-helix domain-containing protein n=1 Tax=Paenibacillus chondroitinus TaxID=59842 RepID=A0ABU6DAZ5_9BACL|nr:MULTISPECIES: helix-turn-helix domain-containing protein [Paenibacillus]MCY9656817.1 helix-turn-helix domain-containing protein [Paenibacillus anseongense]MEB4794467.1 helix-turn-helix domain-containing protein [Paenibacillus chondroitinus]